MTSTLKPQTSLQEAIPSLVPHPLTDNFRYIDLYRAKADDPSVLVVALARPHKRNAINARLWKEIGIVFGCVGGQVSDPQWCCRSVMLVGLGKAFCAGIDVTDLSFFPKTPSVRVATGQVMDENDDGAYKDDVTSVGLQFLPLLRDMQACLTSLETCPVPVVAAIHGPCVGAGIDLVTAADVRFATIDSIWSVKEVALGLAADVGTLQRLPKICGNQSWVRDICLTGRTFHATEAFQYGLVSRLYDNPVALYQAAFAICKTMARHLPTAVRGTKQALVYARDHSVQEGLDQIAAYNALALQSPQMLTAMQARHKSGHSPVFQDLPPASRL